MGLKVYLCGNEMVEADNMPYKILNFLRGGLPQIEFLAFDPTENFPDEDPIYIIDTVLGADKVVVLGGEDLERFENAPHVSAHDADLAFHLKWLKKMGRLPRVVIFGVPEKGDVEKIAGEVISNLGADQF